MIHLERSIVIARDPETVFSLIGDPDRYEEFFVGITRWTPRSTKKRGTGARYRVLMKVGSIEAGGIVRVTQWSKPKRIAWESEQGLHQMGRWKVSKDGGGARLTLEIDFDLSGGPVGWVVERVTGRIVGRNMWATLLTARRVLEAKDSSYPESAVGDA